VKVEEVEEVEEEIMVDCKFRRLLSY